MPLVSVRIPQIGEGLQEARLVAVLKNPGDPVKRDEPIYQMETDKAVMDVESPYEGVLSRWNAEVDTVLPIGAEVATMEVADGVSEIPAAHGSPVEVQQTPMGAITESMEQLIPSTRRTDIPPRTRAYAKEKGLTEEQLARVAATGGRLMPGDIDAFLQSQGAQGTSDAYEERPLSQKQRLLASRLVRGAQLVVPGTMSVVCDWKPIEAARAKLKAAGGEFQPSAFTVFAYAVALAARDHPAFRTTLVGDSTLRTYRHLNLGIAVGLPGDELVLAVVEDADSLGWREFAVKARAKIDLARAGKDQANEAMTLSLTNMQSFGLRDAVPVVVPPAVATLFLGEVYNALAQEPVPEGGQPKIGRYANLALTFDHRLLNGVGAANFLNAVRENVARIEAIIGG